MGGEGGEWLNLTYTLLEEVRMYFLILFLLGYSLFAALCILLVGLLLISPLRHWMGVTVAERSGASRAGSWVFHLFPPFFILLLCYLLLIVSPLLTPWLREEPPEMTRERDPIENNIRFARFGVGMEQNRALIPEARLWDWHPFLNRRFEETQVDSLTMTTASESSAEGLFNRSTRDRPAKTSYPILKVVHSQRYDGTPADMSVSTDREDELSVYPAIQSNAYFRHKGLRIKALPELVEQAHLAFSAYLRLQGAGRFDEAAEEIQTLQRLLEQGVRERAAE
jgi:hypothetical protein